jgi:hypothetical protein
MTETEQIFRAVDQIMLRCRRELEYTAMNVPADRIDTRYDWHVYLQAFSYLKSWGIVREYGVNANGNTIYKFI